MIAKLVVYMSKEKEHNKYFSATKYSISKVVESELIEDPLPVSRVAKFTTAVMESRLFQQCLLSL